MEKELDLSKSFDKKESVIMQDIDEDEIFPPEENSNIFCTRKTEGNKKTNKSLIKRRSLELVKESQVHGSSLRHARSLSSHILINIDAMMSDGDDEKGALINKTSSGKMGIFSYDRSSISSSSISDDVTLENSRKSKNSQFFGCSESNILDLKASYPMDQEDQDSCSWKRIQIEPTLRIHVKFQDVKYIVSLKGVDNSDAEKCILQGVSGSACPGEILALMGPSGGGKTTLLKLLSGTVKNDSGMITYNDQPYNKSLKQRIGFVLQDDVVFPHLTVKETLTYAALLRLPNTLSKEQKKERAIRVINELGLERCQDTIIGGAFVRGISGGERKRVCIGNEILLNPSLLFLDEPTSGLDSTTALRIMQMLRNIARAGKTVVTTIHQPSSRLFSIFDKLILLGQGSSLYFGKASEAMLYFSSIGCSPLIAMNPAEFLIDLANGNITEKSIPSDLEDKLLLGNHHFKSQRPGPSPADVHEYFVGAYESRVANIEKIKLLKHRLIEEDSQVQSWPNSRDSGATWCQQFSVLFRRSLKERSHEYFSSIRITQVIATAIIVGLLWWRHSDTSSPKRVSDQAGLLFFISVFWVFFPLVTAIFTFPQERAMLVKERSVNMYKLSAYFIARITTDLFLDLVLPITFLVIVYFMDGLQLTFRAFSLTLLTILLSIIAAQGLGLAIGAAFMDMKKATTFASVILMTFMLSAGFFVQEVPAFISWIRYISINYHTYRLLLKIQYNSLRSSKYGSVDDSTGLEVGAMFVMVIGYRMLAYFLLRKMKLRTIA